MMTKNRTTMTKNKMKVKIMSRSNVKSLNALSAKLGKVSDAYDKVGALKNIYSALSGKESKGITVSDVIDEITSVAEKPTTQEVIWPADTVSNEVTKVSIPEGVTIVDDYAFQDCGNLAAITIPKSVRAIGNYAFQDCRSLANIYFRGTEEQWNAIIKADSWNKTMGENVTGGTVITYNYTG